MWRINIHVQTSLVWQWPALPCQRGHPQRRQSADSAELHDTIWLAKQNYGSVKVSCLVSKMTTFIFQKDSCQAGRLACWLAVSVPAALLRESSLNALFQSVLLESMCSFRATNIKLGEAGNRHTATSQALVPRIHFCVSSTQNPIPVLSRSNPETTRPSRQPAPKTRSVSQKWRETTRDAEVAAV